MSLPKVCFTITRDNEIGKYSLEDEYGVVLKDVHLSDIFREIDDIETDDGFNSEEPDIDELHLGMDLISKRRTPQNLESGEDE